MLNKIYMLVAAAVIGLFGASGYYGWELGNSPRTVVPPDARRSPGWAHTGGSHIWYSGYRGGK